jgi:hypothetical protein
MKKLLLFVLLALGALSAPANAQQASSAFIVSACGTLPAGVTYAAGQYGILTMDTTGKLCDSATGGGGGGGAVTIVNGGNVVEGSTTDTPCTVPTSATACTLDAILKAVANGAITLGPAAITSSVPTIPSSQYPANNVGAAVPITGSSGNVAASSAVATLAAAASKFTYISGFQATGSGATLGSCVNVTITGVVGGTMTYTFCAAAGVLISDAPLIVPFNPPLQSSSVNTAIVVTMPSLGTGNTNAAVSAQGYQL